MKKRVPVILLLSFVFSVSLMAQSEWLHKANAEFEMKAYDQAVLSYAEYLKVQPDDIQALQRIAESYEFINDLENAILWYDKVLSHSVTADYLFRYGKLLMRSGQYDKAKKQFLTYATVDKTVGGNYAKMCDYAFSKKEMAPLYKMLKLSINSEFAEFSPTFFQNELIYVSGRNDVPRNDAPAANAGKGRNNNYVYKSQFQADMTLAPPQYLRSWLKDNNGENEGPIAYSADGKWVAFVKNNYVDGVSLTSATPKKTDIYMASVLPNGDWEEAILFPFGGEFSNHYPCLSADGTTLFFSSNRPGGEGGYDLYQSTKKNGVWTAPRNLGSTINKPGNEITPYLDESELYFSSDYLMGFGGYDVFKAVIDDRAWVISNLGTGVNTPSNDFGFIYRQQLGTGFLVSDREGNENIYRATKTSNDLSISIKDASSGMPLPHSVLDFKHCGKGVYKTNEKGQLVLKASGSLECRVVVMREGYESHEIQLDKNSISTGFIEVELFKKGEKYEGSIIDGLSDGPVAGATIRAINQTEGTKIETISDERGVYSIALKPQSKYMITFSKIGYVDVTIKPDTKDGTDKSILGSLLLFPTTTSGTGEPSPTVSTPTVPSVPSVPTVSQPTPSVPSPTAPPQGEPVVATPIISTPTTPSPTPTTSVVEGYAVQLLSLSVGNSKTPKGLNTIQGMVNRIYIKSDETWKRYRVGVYTTREEAEQVKAYVREMGFKKAYVVEEDATGNIQDAGL